MRAGGPGALLVLQGRLPSACWKISLHNRVSVSYRHATAEAAGNGSTPCIFTHPTRLGHIIAFYTYGGRGGVRCVGGKGLDTKHAAQSHAPELETAHANYRQKPPNSRYKAVTTRPKTMAPPPSGAGGGRLPRVGFLWGLFRSCGSTGNAGDTRVPSPPLLQSGLPSHICLGSPLVSPGPPATRSSWQDAAPLIAGPATAPRMVCPQVSRPHH